MKNFVALFIITFSAFRLSSQSLEQTNQELQLLIVKRSELTDSLENLNKKIELLQKKILYLEYKESQALGSKFISTTKAFGSPYMMIGSSQKTRIDLDNGITIELLDYDGKKLKIFASDQIGFIWPSDVEDQELVNQFINLIEGKSVVDGTNKQPTSPQKAEPIHSTNQPNIDTGPVTSPAKSSSYTPKTSKSYHRGPRGGCYYYSSSGKKVYVDRSLCN
ncbi:hypothetical protein RT717_00290 [Imperialibacter roseus]|uniref:PBCV-specific basic adaptor domain-containing protein n=1 Tax=Imperialibacter roseus TaxID=1324217 RepID=A0ABZ0IRJ3_9BACT|nr:hypothetical protein [Imperialibacter roseus]WOK07058.1 hypothetical protein RT717_00290 [Imperialibacter roseus]